MKSRKNPMPKTREDGIIRVLQLGCLGLVAAMALNAPSPNGQGGWRDQFMDGYREARSGSAPAPADVDRSVAAGGGEGVGS